MKNKGNLSFGKRLVVTIGTIAICLIAGIAILSTLINNGDSKATDTSSLAANKVTTSGKADTSPLYEDKLIKITYCEIFEVPSIKGACYLRLLVENKSDKKITVYLKDAYVNDMATFMGSGVPMTIEMGKKSQQPFTFFYSNLDISKMSEIKNIQFKVWITDENTKTLEETGTLKVTP
ncbi:MAG: hypothetical protein Q8865_04270 [Bacillota bacterium]|nr:hypothetical protein [Bacillota bacterium]